MRIDTNGYVIVKSYQVIPVESDAFAEIQAALDSDYRVIFIGESGDDYVLSQPAFYGSNKTIILQGTFKIKDGVTSLVTSNVSAEATSFDVANGGLFNVGEWVAITDDAQIAAYDTLRGSSGRITDITDNTITFDSICTYNYLTSENAYVGHTQSVFIGENVDNVKIIGIDCEINGNRENQSQIHPTRNVSVIEDQRAGCGLVVWKGSNIEIDGVVIRDSLLHNFSISSLDSPVVLSSENIILRNCEGYNGHDKNFLIRDIDGVELYDLIANDATWEDGIIFYANVLNAIVDGIYAEGNHRAGFYWNSSSNNYLTAQNITTRDNTRGVYLVSKGATISNVDSNDMLNLSSQYDCSDNVLTNIALHDIDADYCLYLWGNIENIEINNLTITDCSVPAIKSAEFGSEELPINVTIEGGGIYNHTGYLTEIQEGSDITFTDFEGLT